MTRIETIKGIIGILWAISVGLWELIGELNSAHSEFGGTLLLYLYIFQIAVVPYAHCFIHNEKWYSATLITLCVSNVFYCAFIAIAIIHSNLSNNPWHEFATIVGIILLIPMIVITIIIIVASNVSYKKRKGSFQ